jgi:Na+/H+ antiporter NhaD/arsenite permease-like protein
MKNWIYALASIALLIVPTTLFASSDVTNLGLTSSLIGLTCVVIFCVAYGFVMVEEFIHLPKSKPVIFAAGLIWMLVAYLASQSTIDPQAIRQVLEHNLIEYASLFLFLLVAMTYINAMTERNVFQALRSWLVSQGFNYKQLFWITGWIAFFLSPIADNLTTALLMGAVVMSVGIGNSRFVSVACVNIVVAANAVAPLVPLVTSPH